MPICLGDRSRIMDISLLLIAFFWVCRVRSGLTLSTLEKIRRHLLPETLAVSDASVDIPRLAWSVRRVARIVPMATCLTRALALQIILARKGVSAELVLGVGRSASKEFLAHAWLEKDGQIVIGGSERKIGNFSRLATYGSTCP